MEGGPGQGQARRKQPGDQAETEPLRVEAASPHPAHKPEEDPEVYALLWVTTARNVNCQIDSYTSPHTRQGASRFERCGHDSSGSCFNKRLEISIWLHEPPAEKGLPPAAITRRYPPKAPAQPGRLTANTQHCTVVANSTLQPHRTWCCCLTCHSQSWWDHHRGTPSDEENNDTLKSSQALLHQTPECHHLHHPVGSYRIHSKWLCSTRQPPQSSPVYRRQWMRNPHKPHIP